jgi:Sensors of blue-light using FAD
MHRLVYVSKATDVVNDGILKEITDVAVTNNKKLSVTGCMLYASGYFLQLLEGDKKDVITLYKKIEKDPRHKACKLLLDENFEDDYRLYDKWFMTAFNVGKTSSFPDELKQSIDDIVNNRSSAVRVHRLFMEFKKYLAN